MTDKPQLTKEYYLVNHNGCRRVLKTKAGKIDEWPYGKKYMIKCKQSGSHPHSPNSLKLFTTKIKLKVIKGEEMNEVFRIGRTHTGYEAGPLSARWKKNDTKKEGRGFREKDRFCWLCGEEFEKITGIRLKMGECRKFKLVEVKK